MIEGLQALVKVNNEYAIKLRCLQSVVKDNEEILAIIKDKEQEYL